MNYGKFTPQKMYWSSPEVVKLTGIPAHTLRYWEEVIPYLQVPKNRAKKRMYRQQDIDFILALKSELEKIEEKETLSSIGKKLIAKRQKKPILEVPPSPPLLIEKKRPKQEVLQNIKAELLEAISRLNNSKKNR